MKKSIGESRPRRGTILVLSAFLMFIMCGMVAFAIDTGYIVLTRTELQRAADAGAMGGAYVLLDGPAAAISVAQRIAQSNIAAGDEVLVLPSEDIELGRWNDKTATFEVLTGTAREEATAIRVTCRVTTERGNAAELFFAPIFGRRSVEVEATATAVLERSKCSRIIGLNAIYCEDGATDSYDASLGSYTSQMPGEEGNICTNGSIQLNSGTSINGDATPGKNQSLSLGPGAIVTGSTAPGARMINVPPIDASEAFVSNNNSLIPQKYLNSYNDLEINGTNTLTLPGGTYYIPGKLTISGEGVLAFTGPAELYVAGNVSITGKGILNGTGVPANLRIFTLGTAADFAGNAAMHANVYGPSTAVSVRGNGGLYGGVVGKTLYMNGNGGIHADMSLPLDKYAVLYVRMVQ